MTAVTVGERLATAPLPPQVLSAAAATEALQLLRAAAAVAGSAARRAATWTEAERRHFVAEADRTITALITARALALTAERDAGTWRGSGDATFEAWRSRTSRSGIRAAGAETRRGDALQAMPAMRAAAEAGEVSVEHLDAVASMAAGGSESVREALATPQGQAQLVGMARRMDAGRFARSAAVWVAEVDQGGVERDHQAQRVARYLNVVDGRDGTRITGRLDRMAGHRLRLALEAVGGRPAADDDRSSEQRRADALEALADTLLSLPETGSGAAVRPHVSFIMTAETWAALRAARAEIEGDAAGWVSHVPTGVDPVALEDGTPVPPSEVARALCDCQVTRIVTDATGVPVDLGRTARTYTGEQRRAVIARDRGCLWPGCDRPPRWCEVHHLRWWDRDGGETSVDCGALVCSFHHHEIHRLELAVTRHMIPRNQAPPGTGRARYVLTRSDGTVVADGRPSAGAPPAQAHVGAGTAGVEARVDAGAAGR